MVLYHKKPPRGFWGAIKFSPYSPPNRPLWYASRQVNLLLTEQSSYNFNSVISFSTFTRRTAYSWQRVQFETTTLAHLLASCVRPETLEPGKCPQSILTEVSAVRNANAISRGVRACKLDENSIVLVKNINPVLTLRIHFRFFVPRVDCRVYSGTF